MCFFIFIFVLYFCPLTIICASVSVWFNIKYLFLGEEWCFVWFLINLRGKKKKKKIKLGLSNVRLSISWDESKSLHSETVFKMNI